MKLLDLEDDLSRTDCFASLPARRKRESRRPFKIDLRYIYLIKNLFDLFAYFSSDQGSFL